MLLGFGNWTKDCTDRIQAKPIINKKDYGVNIAKETTSGDESDYYLMVASSVCSKTQSEWILDSRCLLPS